MRTINTLFAALVAAFFATIAARAEIAYTFYEGGDPHYSNVEGGVWAPTNYVPLFSDLLRRRICGKEGQPDYMLDVMQQSNHWENLLADGKAEKYISPTCDIVLPNGQRLTVVAYTNEGEYVIHKDAYGWQAIKTFDAFEPLKAQTIPRLTNAEIVAAGQDRLRQGQPIYASGFSPEAWKAYGGNPSELSKLSSYEADDLCTLGPFDPTAAFTITWKGISDWGQIIAPVCAVVDPASGEYSVLVVFDAFGEAYFYNTGLDKRLAN